MQNPHAHLAELLPCPSPVRLAGRTYFARPLSIAGLARLAALDEAARGDAGDGLAAAEAAGDADALRACHARAEEGGGRPWRALRTEAGRRTYLLLTVDTLDGSPADTASLAAEMTPGDWDRLDRIARGADDLAEAEAAIDRHLNVALPPPDDDGDDEAETVTWAEIVAELCVQLGKTPAEVGELTPGQARLIRRGGKASTREYDTPAGWDEDRFDAEVQAPRRKFWGID